ncbi:MAG: hypothetical protein P8P49_00850 [Opitutales bacterium]|nr:hypothetical protein [Opitutales bacterium]
MQQRKFLARSRKALIKHGIIGSRAKALLEEWNDHLESEVEKLVAGGQDRESSYQAACKSLGEPESLVDSAAKQLAMESWQGRNPVLSSGILSLVVFILGILVMVAGGSLLKAYFDYLSPEMIKHLVTLIDTLPWLLCLGWLAYHARKMPLGWKGLWFVTVFTAIIPSFLGFTCDSPNRTMTVFMAFLPIGSISKFIITFGLTSFFWWFQTRNKKLEDESHLVS